MTSPIAEITGAPKISPRSLIIELRKLKVRVLGGEAKTYDLGTMIACTSLALRAKLTALR
jgi:hypothetical protein